MTVYKCDRCDKKFKQKFNLDRHLNRKNPCKNRTIFEPKLSQSEPYENEYETLKNSKNEPQNEPQNKKEYKCKYCCNIFSTNSHYNRHIKHNCKTRRELEEEKANIFKQLLTEIHEIRKENMEVKEKIMRMSCRTKITKNTNTTNSNNIIKDNIVNNNTIVLVGCGKEDIMKFDKQKVIRAISAGFYSTHKLTDLVHFDPEHPEYHNVYIGNMKDKYAMMYDGTNWILTTKTEIIDKLYESKKAFVEGNFDDFCKLLSANQQRALGRWLATDEDDPKIAEIKESIKLLLYNKRAIPLQTRDYGQLKYLQ